MKKSLKIFIIAFAGVFILSNMVYASDALKSYAKKLKVGTYTCHDTQINNKLYTCHLKIFNKQGQYSTNCSRPLRTMKAAKMGKCRYSK